MLTTVQMTFELLSFETLTDVLMKTPICTLITRIINSYVFSDALHAYTHKEKRIQSKEIITHLPYTCYSLHDV